MRLWVKRGFNGTPSSIQLENEDLIDDVKDAVFRKYPVALARTYDSPDVSICIVKQNTGSNLLETRILNVDERVSELVRSNFPSGQRVEEALVIQVPGNNASKSSPYTGPAIRHGSPLSGTLHLLTNDMRDFEYFPPTPPVAGDHSTGPPSSEYNRNFVPSNYSSGSHSSGSYAQGAPVTAFEGSVRPAPTLTMGAMRRQDRAQRPTMATRTGTNSSSNPSVGVYGRTTDGSVTFHPKQQSRPSRAASNGSAHIANTSPRTVRTAEEDEGLEQPTNPSSAGPEGSNNFASLVVTDSEAPTNLRHSISNTMAPLPEISEPVASNSTPATVRARRETGTFSPVAARPTLGGRTLTASKMNIVSPAGSQHSSTHSVVKLEAAEGLAKKKIANPSTFGVGGLLEGVVPPIDVLIVEDNMINQRILETFMKKRKIRCLTAKNGREAVEKWKKGGIHLVLMDIHMPIMSGIEATKEIRRLERSNSIGVFSKKEHMPEPEPDDILTDLHFRSPVIIVALTASSLQSDRHEALAAGCNDFLTKPVSLVWLEKKVLEWGCMQALIDFEGWKKFRGLKEAQQ